MTKILLATFFVVTLSSPSLAQGFSRIDVVGGYASFHVGAGKTEVKLSGDVLTVSRGSGVFNGWNISLGYNPTRWVGIVGDFSEAYGEIDYNVRIIGVSSGVISASSGYRSLLAGPQFSLHRKKTTIFARALAGVSTINQSANLTGQEITARGSSYAVTWGGGMDFKITKRFSWRVVQSDYVLTHFRERIGGAASQHNLRLSTGLVLHLLGR